MFEETNMSSRADSNPLTIIAADDGSPHDDVGMSPSPVNVEIGQWYWVKETTHRGESEWLGCTVHVGSNYLKLDGPAGSRSSYTARVHFDNFWTDLRFEPNPEAVISGKVAHYQGIADQHMNEVRAITARLGVSTQTKLGEAQASKSDNALMVLNGQQHLDDYKSALVLAETKQLPELFEKIKEAHGSVAAWMTANTLPMQAMADGMKGTIGEIKDRIFNVSLYAGLMESIVKCRDGEPAAFHEKLRVMQRMFYMDEECLLNYEHGGMTFDKIEQFDAWLARDENLNRVLPAPRCLIAMRVRRKSLERDWDGSIRSLFINMNMREADKATFLYIRNGDQLYRLANDLDFGESIFPDRGDFDPSRPSMVKMFASRVDQIISRDDYDERVKADKDRKRMSAQWRKENPKEKWEAANPNGMYQWADPHRESGMGFRPDDWGPFDPSNVYFDDISEKFAKEMKEHNRIALIIQGLFDRSEILHPHPPVKVWSPSSFSASIDLVYDGSNVLHDGDAPDFEAYRARCNALLTADSIVIGQDLYWQEKEAEKECRRLDNDWRSKSEHRPKRFKPRGNKGPGYLARMAEWKPRSRSAKFTWHRERQTSGGRWSGNDYGDPIHTSIVVPADRLFNVSAYQLGDYRQFFQDSRTRAAYLKWAPLLLAAEEYQAGCRRDLVVQNPVPE
jgi:hypothetical protein